MLRGMRRGALQRAPTISSSSFLVVIGARVGRRYRKEE